MNFLRFRDLKQRGVVMNWTTLVRLVREQGFPAGTRLGAQTRAWDEAEVEAWLESRRIPAPAASIVAKADATSTKIRQPTAKDVASIATQDAAVRIATSSKERPGERGRTRHERNRVPPRRAKSNTLADAIGATANK